MTERIQTEDLERSVAEYQARGYRLDMIFPADDPREALVSKDGESIRLIRSPDLGRGFDASLEGGSSDTWIKGRAGMEYRDLIPDRLGGKAIASHIRLLEDGPVADYVHFHKIDFQMIYCLKGRINVVYEDQGEPFWLEAGDCVVQPPEIRHRVLFAEGNAEVLEVTMPAEHETWIDHEMGLPNAIRNPDRLFSGQKFVLTKAG
jgi:mannose-6-phosphate isomerase-like protein (cupin superfamily)